MKTFNELSNELRDISKQMENVIEAEWLEFATDLCKEANLTGDYNADKVEMDKIQVAMRLEAIDHMLRNEGTSTGSGAHVNNFEEEIRRGYAKKVVTGSIGMVLYKAYEAVTKGE